jgi:hypothetical protein
VIVLDTNVISALMHTDTPIFGWLDRQPAQSVWTTSISVYEVRFGIEVLTKGRRRENLAAAFERLIVELDDRILAFDAPAAEAAAEIAGHQRKVGRPIEIRDVQIAGIVAARKATLATRNIRHFERIGLTLVDPWST